MALCLIKFFQHISFFEQLSHSLGDRWQFQQEEEGCWPKKAKYSLGLLPSLHRQPQRLDAHFKLPSFASEVCAWRGGSLGETCWVQETQQPTDCWSSRLFPANGVLNLICSNPAAGIFALQAPREREPCWHMLQEPRASHPEQITPCCWA